MKMLADKLVPNAVKQLIPYQSARRIARATNMEGSLWLNANELETACHYGDSSLCHQGDYHRYPDFLPEDIAMAYKNYCQQYQLDSESLSDSTEIMAVRGADEAIDLLVRTYCQPGHDQIMICPPTYGMYEFCADAFMVNSVSVPLTSDFQLDLPQIEAQLADTSILFLCSPNNPTGNVLDRQDLMHVLEISKDSCLVVMDEAYIEFTPESSVLSLMATYPHLVVIRTLSKAFGLAAIRIGFLLADASVMQYIARLIAPYPIADPSAEITLQALSENGIAQMRRQTQQLIQVRDDFVHHLARLPIVEKVYPSFTNFVLVRFKANHDIYQYLLSQGIVTRMPTSESGVKGCVRISIGSQQSMETILLALQHYPHQ